MSEILPIKQLFLKYSHPIRKLISTDGVVGKPSNSKNSTEPENEILQKVLDSMFTIKSYKSGDYSYEGHVSTVPSNRTDVLSLKESLDSALHNYEARETGICPIRRQLYDHCFDEIIRQVTVNCMDRGMLLYNIRNEIRMTFESLEYIRQSGIAFGLRIALRYNSEENLMKIKLTKLEREIIELKNQLEKSKQAFMDLTKDKNEIIDVIEKTHTEEVKSLKTIIHQQRMLIESLKRKPIKF